MCSTKPVQISYVQKCTTDTRVNQIKNTAHCSNIFFCTDINNQMIPNHPPLSLNDKQTDKNPPTCHSVPSTVPYKYTCEDKYTCNRT